MSNSFLNTGNNSQLVDGSANLYIKTLRLRSINPNNIVKTNGFNQLISDETININEVSGLQTELNNINDELKTVLINPLMSNLDINGYNIVNASTIESKLNTNLIIKNSGIGTVNIDNGINMTGITKTINNPILSNASCSTVFSLAGNSILSANSVGCISIIQPTPAIPININSPITMNGGGALKTIFSAILSGASCSTFLNLNTNNIINAGIVNCTNLSHPTPTTNIDINSPLNMNGVNKSINGVELLNASCISPFNLNTNNIINAGIVNCTNLSHPTPTTDIILNSPINANNKNISSVNVLSSASISVSGRAVIYNSISNLIYSNASWARQQILLTATGATLSPVLAGAVNEYNMLPFASSLLGTLTIPANTLLRGDVFKLTITGTYIKSASNVNVFYKFYMLNETTNNYFLISTIQDSTNSVMTQTYKLEQILYLRTDPGVAGFAVSNAHVFSGTTNGQLNNTGVLFNTTNPQRFVVTVVFDGGVNAANSFSTHTTNLQTM